MAFTSKEQARRIAAAEKRIETANDRIDRYGAKVEDARALKATAEGELAWLKSMPTDQQPQLDIFTADALTEGS